MVPTTRARRPLSIPVIRISAATDDKTASEADVSHRQSLESFALAELHHRHSSRTFLNSEYQDPGSVPRLENHRTTRHFRESLHLPQRGLSLKRRGSDAFSAARPSRVFVGPSWQSIDSEIPEPDLHQERGPRSHQRTLLERQRDAVAETFGLHANFTTQNIASRLHFTADAGLIQLPQEQEKDDWLHSSPANGKEPWTRDLLSLRAIANCSSLFTLTMGLMLLFVLYPIL